jgi:hypothetical protein
VASKINLSASHGSIDPRANIRWVFGAWTRYPHGTRMTAGPEDAGVGQARVAQHAGDGVAEAWQVIEGLFRDRLFSVGFADGQDQPEHEAGASPPGLIPRQQLGQRCGGLGHEPPRDRRPARAGRRRGHRHADRLIDP